MEEVAVNKEKRQSGWRNGKTAVRGHKGGRKKLVIQEMYEF